LQDQFVQLLGIAGAAVAPAPFPLEVCPLPVELGGHLGGGKHGRCRCTQLGGRYGAAAAVGGASRGGGRGSASGRTHAKQLSVAKAKSTGRRQGWRCDKVRCVVGRRRCNHGQR